MSSRIPVTSQEKRLANGETFKSGQVMYSPNRISSTHYNSYGSGLAKVQGYWIYTSAEPVGPWGYSYQVCSNPTPESWRKG